MPKSPRTEDMTQGDINFYVEHNLRMLALQERGTATIEEIIVADIEPRLRDIADVALREAVRSGYLSQWDQRMIGAGRRVVDLELQWDAALLTSSE